MDLVTLRFHEDEHGALPAGRDSRGIATSSDRSGEPVIHVSRHFEQKSRLVAVTFEDVVLRVELGSNGSTVPCSRDG
jgi:hypothetical protein